MNANTIEIEKEFWKLVENNESERVKVEYAADLPTSDFGVGEDTNSKYKSYSEHPWNLNKMHMKNNSLLQFCKDKPISGITMSWLYVGMLFSSF
jgi:hypothetical protein